jgi:protein SCO1/2
MDQNGRPLDARALSGHWLLVYFGYASCKEICPAALSTLGAVLNRLGPAADRIEPTFLYLVAPDGQVVQMLHPQQPVDDLVATIRSHFVNWAQ